jgi:hypothetical protein
VVAFGEANLHGLGEAVARLAGGSPVVPTLVLAIDPRHWLQTRSAISGLRRQGPAAAAAAPAIAGWIALSVDRARTADQHYTVNEAMNGLADMRAGLAALGAASAASTAVTAEEADEDAPPGAPPDHVARIARFLDEVFQPYLLGKLTPPLRIWQRGAVAYLRGLHGDLTSVATALQGLLLALQRAPEPPAADADWFACLRMDLVGVVADVGVRLARPGPEPEPERAEGGSPVLPPAVVRLLGLAADDPDPQVRAAAIDALVTSGVRADLMLALALEAAASQHAGERAAAARLLAVLI